MNPARQHASLGEAHFRLGHFDEAITSFRRVVELEPHSARAHYNLGTVYSQAGRADDAIACYRHALGIDPAFSEALGNLGEQLARLERLDEAMETLRQAIALRPNFALAHNSLGNALARSRREEEAEECLRRALAIDPAFAVAHWNRAMILFRLGRWEEGWREYEWRWRYPEFRSAPRNFLQPQWDGTPAPGATILVHCEQGFGDAIQFVRYVPFVRPHAQGARVILECPNNLVRLFANGDDWDAEIVETGAFPPFDLHVPMLSLPLVLKKYEPLTISRPYLHAPLDNEKPTEVRVGLAWAGNPTHSDDHKRSIAPARLAPLLGVEGVSFYNLQIGTSISPILSIPPIADFADTAAFMAKLDLVITVDTAVAHLAGALGKPVWTLLPFLADWRWGAEGEHTPWYPTMRLFRQRTRGDWEEVVQRVTAELRALPR